MCVESRLVGVENGPRSLPRDPLTGVENVGRKPAPLAPVSGLWIPVDQDPCYPLVFHRAKGSLHTPSAAVSHYYLLCSIRGGGVVLDRGQPLR